MKTIEIKIKKYSDIEYTCICELKPKKLWRDEDIDVIKILDDDGQDVTSVIEWLGITSQIENLAYETYLKSTGRM